MQIKKETKIACKSGFSIWRRPGATKAVEWPGRLRAAYPRRRAVGFSGKTNSTGSILSCIGKKGRARGGGRILGPSPFDRETRSPPSPSPRACLYRSLSLLGSEFAALAAFVEKSVPLYPGSSSFVFAPRGTFPAGLLSPMALALGERGEGWGGMVLFSLVLVEEKKGGRILWDTGRPSRFWKVLAAVFDFFWWITGWGLLEAVTRGHLDGQLRPLPGLFAGTYVSARTGSNSASASVCLFRKGSANGGVPSAITSL